MRYAIYFTPPRGHLLTRLASAWIGRDAYTGEPIAPPDRPGVDPRDLANKTAAARRYGFHATLMAPFELAGGFSQDQLLDAARDFVADRPAAALPALKVTLIDSFLALTPSTAAPEADALASDVVKGFSRFRAPLSDAEVARRGPDRLTTRQMKHLRDWGYPYVFDDFRFHMTLTGPLELRDAPVIARLLEDHLAPALAGPTSIESISVFVEPFPGAPFNVLSTHEFGAGMLRRSA